MLSIPAIWTDSARQFMREAATNAGLENVRLVLEPEAGALFAIDKPLYMREDKFAGKFPVGHKYILADLGGGTIDICVHEILADVIIEKLKEILSSCPLDNITTLLLVGGYSESPYVRERIKQELPKLSTVIVEDGRLAVTKGAVMMGRNPRNIIQRRARFTYGFRQNAFFIEGLHLEKFKYYKDGEARCAGVFVKLIRRGQLLQHRQEFSREVHGTFKQPETKHDIQYTSLWRSPWPDPMYCTIEEDQCEEVGRISMHPPPGGWPDVVNGEQKLTVGETEFTMNVRIQETGEECDTNIDFL
ncbi:HS12A-like protein [Mya arenaria]|uniref:HS12A-like protein n=1 Tax=Mya arenaria TaxID=6604 RepID=A0ABY7FB71_MYAAR|nr:HS12A-like protein [Mya arenaria]